MIVVFLGVSALAIGSSDPQDSSDSKGASDRKHKILSLLFDGVPKPGTEGPKKARKKKAVPEPPVTDVVATIAAVERPRPEIEKLNTWEEVLKALPIDIAGGPDWVAAVKSLIVAPRSHLPSDPPAAAPFTLSTFLRASPQDEVPPFDLNVDIVPEQLPFYKAVFPHAGHSLWLSCSSCHPGGLARRGSGMREILAGESCGRCHGKVAFAPIGECARCHAALKPAAREVIEADLARAAQQTMPASPDTLEHGKALYIQECAVCHGEKGDGNGPLADAVDPRPRDLTSGKFKFRSTNSSSLPTDFDMFQTITRGLAGTSMPDFSSLSYDDRSALTQFIKTFSDKFATQQPEAPIRISEPPPRTPALMEIGQKLYREAECNKCHGDTGHGDGPSADTLKDDWDRPLRPFDLTAGRAKGGTTVRDYYRVFMTGLKGTPMPDYGEVFEPEQAWALAYYALSLGDANRNLPPAVRGDIFFRRKASAQPANPELEDAPPGVFAHWLHRMRVRCAVCHPDTFQMKAGANDMTMDAIRDGQFCGKCHPSYPDPKALVAWTITFDSCARCHPTP